MRRKSERNKAKPVEKKPEPTPKKSRRSSRRRKRSTSRSSSEDSDDVPLKSAPAAAPEIVVPEVVPPATEAEEEPKKPSSHSNSDEDKDEQPIWKVKTSDASSGEIQKLKICLQRPSTTPERTEKSPRRRRGKTSSQSDEASLTPDEKIHKRKTRNSPSVYTSEGSSLDNSAIEAAEKDENLIIIKETNEVIIGKGKLDSSQTKQDSENETCVLQDSQIEDIEKESHNDINTKNDTIESNNDHDEKTAEQQQVNEESAKKQTDEVQYSEENKVEEKEIVINNKNITQPETTSAKDAAESDTNKEIVPDKNESEIPVEENKTDKDKSCDLDSTVLNYSAVSEETNESAEIKDTTMEETSIVEEKADEKLPENVETSTEKMDISNEPDTLMETSEIASKEDEKPVNQTEESPEVQEDTDKKSDETCTKLKETNEELKDTNEEVKETNEEVKETNEEVKEINEEVKEANEEVKEINEEVKETNEEVKEINEEVKETNEELKETNEKLVEVEQLPAKIEKTIEPSKEAEESKEVEEPKEPFKEVEKPKEVEEPSKEVEKSNEPSKEVEEPKEPEVKQDALIKEDSVETIEDSTEKSQESVETIEDSNEKTQESVETIEDSKEETTNKKPLPECEKPDDIETKSDTSESNRKLNKTTAENEEESSERIVRKRKWGKYKVSLPIEQQRVTLQSIASFCPSVRMLSVEELKLERHDARDYEPKLPKRERVKDKDTVQIPSPPTKNDDDTEKDVSNIGLNRKISIVNDEASKLQPPPSPATNPVSAILYITNLVRPFTLKQLQELLSRTGKIVEDGFWTDKIKSKCYVEYETEEEAENTRNALHGVQWPTGNGKKLIIDFATAETMKAARNVNTEIPVVAKTMPDETPENVAENVKKEIASNDQRWDNQRTTAPIREWDVGKVPQDFRDRSRSKERADSRSDRADKRRPSRNESPSNGDQLSSRKKRKDEQTEVKLMDDLFNKTKATPSIYWLPLSPDQIAKKQQQRLQRMAEHKRRMEESRRFDRDRDFGRGGGQRARRRSARYDGD